MVYNSFTDVKKNFIRGGRAMWQSTFLAHFSDSTFQAAHFWMVFWKVSWKQNTAWLQSKGCHGRIKNGPKLNANCTYLMLIIRKEKHWTATSGGISALPECHRGTSPAGLYGLAGASHVTRRYGGVAHSARAMRRKSPKKCQQLL